MYFCIAGDDNRVFKTTKKRAMIKDDTTALIYLAIITPIEKIISKLEQDQYTDADVPMLTDSLLGFSKIACTIVNEKNNWYLANLHMDTTGYAMNEKNKQMFLRYFKTLEKFFKNI